VSIDASDHLQLHEALLQTLLHCLFVSVVGSGNIATAMHTVSMHGQRHTTVRVLRPHVSSNEADVESKEPRW
jgi:hypothetical protein